jgi:hypothetical protein
MSLNIDTTRNYPMRKTMMVWSACAAAIVPACLAGTAMADGVPVQGVGQEAGSYQNAASSATSTQTNPTNNAISVAILSPGAKTGDVSQANNSTANSTASNSNSTSQNAAQAAGGSAAQLAGQAAANAQNAASSATSNQYKPTNNAVSVAILSPHASTGKVDQANNSTANSTAENQNTTDQNAAQSAGGGHGGGGVQGIGQAAGNKQDAQSSAESKQDHPTNNAVSLSILSPGSSTGDVHQANNSTANSTAENENSTHQDATQAAGGAPTMIKDAAPRSVEDCSSCAPEPPKDGCDSCHSDVPGVQGIGQLATNDQSARSSATSTQTNPTNNAVSLSILSPGSYTGPVSQANNSTADSTAYNTNATTQDATQALGGWGGGVQGIGQAAYNNQDAASAAYSDQWCPTNFALGGGGSTGPVDQANNSTADSTAYNTNSTYQNALQTLGAYAWAPLKAL